jgi:hypothetical protein
MRNEECRSRNGTEKKETYGIEKKTVGSKWKAESRKQ